MARIFCCQCQIQKNKDDIPFGLYYLSSDVPQGNSLKLPIEKVEFKTKIINNIAKTQITQVYKNLSPQSISAQYLFPISSDSCFYSFRAEFNDKILTGIVKEKKEAQKEFKDNKEKGNTVALQQICEDSPDIMKIDIANIQGNSEIKIYIEFSEELSVVMNSFYLFKIFSMLSPRYCNSSNMVDFAEYDIVGNDNHVPCVTDLQVELQAKSSIEIWKSPSHNNLKMVSQDKEKNTLKLEIKNIRFDQDFVLLFRDLDINKPSVLLGVTDTQVCAQVNFLPNLTNLSADDAYKQYVQDQKEFQVDIAKCPAEFIFLLDRSGSMSGGRIDQAKEALKIFIKSLPMGSYFNIYSFGTSYEKLFIESEEYTEKTQLDTLKKIDNFSANFGGTNILHPILSIFEEKLKKNMPRLIFLLTDGDVSSPKEIIYHIENNLDNSRVHTIGIGSGCSQYLVKNVAKAGKGQAIFIEDNNDMNNSIIGLLQNSLSPCINQFNLQFDKNIVESISPQPEKVKCIIKNEQISFYVFFKPGLTINDLNTQVQLSFYSNYLNNNLSYFLDINNTCLQDPLISKLGAFKKIQSLQKDLDNEEFINNRNNQYYNLRLYVNHTFLYQQTCDFKSKIIEISLNNQILSQHTAFICLIKQLNDQEQQEYQAQIIQKQEDNINNFDYQFGGIRGGRGGMSRGGRGAGRGIRVGRPSNMYIPPKYSQELSLQSQDSSRKTDIQYLQNIDLSTAFFDPKSRAMRSISHKKAKSRSRSRSRSKSPDKYNTDKFCRLKVAQNSKSQQSELGRKGCMVDLVKIINLQKFQGYWEYNDQILMLLGINENKFLDSLPKNINNNNNYWVSVLVYYFLEFRFSTERNTWQLIQQKCLDWIKKQVRGNDIQEYKSIVQTLF